MFWLRNKKNNFQICTVIWRPGTCLAVTCIQMVMGKCNKHLKVFKQQVTLGLSNRTASKCSYSSHCDISPLFLAGCEGGLPKARCFFTARSENSS